MGRLFLQATELPALLRAATRAARGKRHRPEVARFLCDSERRCLALQRALRLPLHDPESYRPGAPRRFSLLDPKPRLITVVPFADRVVHHALCALIEPWLERYAISDSYACRTGKGQQAALLRLRHLMKGAPWAFKSDIAAYFASIPQDRLLALIHRVIPDAETRLRLSRIIAAYQATPGRGLPIGALTSQHLANLYLGQLDHFVKDQLGVRRYLRYMDDLVLLGERDEVQRAARQIEAFCADRLGLVLNRRVSRIIPTRDGVPLLGFRVYAGLIRARPERLRRFRKSHQAIERALARGEIDEAQAAAKVGSIFAHLRAYDTYRVRRAHLAGADRIRWEARGAWRLLGQRPEEAAGVQPQQVEPRQPQRQRGLSPREFSTLLRGHPAGGPVERSPRTSILCPGTDQVRVQCPGGVVRGTEAQPPGGDPRLRRGMAAGHFPGSR